VTGYLPVPSNEQKPSLQTTEYPALLVQSPSRVALVMTVLVTVVVIVAVVVVA
jgi:hypothetical protein